MSANPKIAILLSTFNGAKFLQEQLDSLLSQTYSNIIIVIRDDGSFDPTPDITSYIAESHGDKVHIVENNKRNLGASASFSFLIEYVLEKKSELGLDEAYMMFCDQDDIWHKDKIEQQVNSMLEVENLKSRDDAPPPLLIHTDLQVVSEENESIAGSLIQYQGLEIERNRFANMVISNLVTGCTALINESLARKAIPVSSHAIMHDWWLALVAAAFGRVVFLDKPLVHYRQHGSNTIGANEFVKPQPASLSFWSKVLLESPMNICMKSLDKQQIFVSALVRN